MTQNTRWLVPAAFWVGVVAAAVALWLSGQAGRAWEQVRDARLLPLVLVVLCGMLLPLIHARRWQIVMRAMGTELPPRLAADLTVSASLVNYASPGYLGAPAKAFLANRSAKAPYSRSLVSMAFEQGLDFLVLLVASLVALAIIGPERLLQFPDVERRTQVLMMVAAVIVFTGLLVVGRHRLQQVWQRISEAFRTLTGRIDGPTIAGLTLLYWLAQAVVVALLLWALHLPVSATSVLALATIPLLAGQIAPLPGGIGAREAAIVALSGATGATTSGLLGLAIVQRVLLVMALPLSLLVLRLLIPRVDGTER